MPDRYTFPRANRITRKPEFDHVFQHGKKQVGRDFVCYVVRRQEPGSQLGMVVSRKVGKAIVRNRVKRYIRQYFRTHASQFAEPLRLVVIARHTTADLDYEQCVRSLHGLLEKGRWLRE